MLFFFEAPPHDVMAVAFRYSTPERVAEFIERGDAGARLPTGTAGFYDFKLRQRPPIALEVMAACGVIPWDGALVTFTAVMRNGEPQGVPLPFRSDLDDDGVCRCGCGVGYRDGRWYDAEPTPGDRYPTSRLIEEETFSIYLTPRASDIVRTEGIRRGDLLVDLARVVRRGETEYLLALPRPRGFVLYAARFRLVERREAGYTFDAEIEN